MPEQVHLLKVLVASPSDIIKEREMVANAIARLNKVVLKKRSIRLEFLGWETDSYPGIGDDAQDVINNEFANNYDIFVGIMWHRYGTPTLRSDSGTVEEFENAYQSFKSNGSCKKILFYFNNADIPQKDVDYSQAAKVRDFEKDLQDKGIYYSKYPGPDSFKDKIYDDLARTVADMDVTKEEKEIRAQGLWEISEHFNNLLINPGANFTHPRKEHLFLEDIFVPPFLRDLNDENKSERIKKISAENIVETYNVDDENGEIHLHIVGADVSGKTALSKYLFLQYKSFGFIPILLKGGDITNNVQQQQLKDRITVKLHGIYRNVTPIKDNSSENKDFILIIDDFQDAGKGNNRYWAPIIKNLENIFPNIIVIGNSLISDNVFADHKPFEKYKKYSLLEFGPDLRYQLVNKWNKAGREIQSNEDLNNLRLDNDRVDGFITSIVGKDFIPAYPFYLLGMLQAYEGSKNPNQEYSLHGFYYEKIINDSLNDSIKESERIGLYYNFLVEVCYAMFNEQKRSISEKDLDGFIDYYYSEYEIDVIKNPKRLFKEEFEHISLISKSEGSYRIAHKYVYFFFVARYLANNIAKAEIKSKIKQLIERVFVDEYANITLFLSHLTKNEFFINALIDSANAQYASYVPAKLEEDISGINKLITNIPGRVINLIKTDDEIARQKQYEAELEEAEKAFDDDPVNYTQFGLDEDLSSINSLAKMNLAMRTIDILGQLAKKYWAEIKRDDKYRLLEATYGLGMRALSMYLSTVEHNKQELAEAVRNFIHEKFIKDDVDSWDPTLNKDKIHQASVNVIINLCYLFSFLIISRISSATGDAQLSLTQERLLNDNPYNSFKLVNLSVKLNTIGIPIDLVKAYSIEMEKSHFCFRLLQDFMVTYLHKFEPSYVVQQRVSEYLKLDIRRQKAIYDSSPIKKD